MVQEYKIRIVESRVHVLASSSYLLTDHDAEIFIYLIYFFHSLDKERNWWYIYFNLKHIFL